MFDIVSWSHFKLFFYTENLEPLQIQIQFRFILGDLIIFFIFGKKEFINNYFF